MGTANRFQIIAPAQFVIKRGDPIFVDENGKFHAELLDDCLPASELKTAREKAGLDGKKGKNVASGAKGVKKKKEWKPRDDLEKRVVEAMERDPSGYSCEPCDIQELHRSRDDVFVFSLFGWMDGWIKCNI